MELGWKKGAVGRHLKALGLKRGVLTVTQVCREQAHVSLCRHFLKALSMHLLCRPAQSTGWPAHTGVRCGSGLGLCLTDSDACLLAAAQERQIRESYEKHKDGPHLLEGIATDIDFRFTRIQIGRHLKKLGLAAGRRNKKKDAAQVPCESL